jgi:hypothetical protein
MLCVGYSHANALISLSQYIANMPLKLTAITLSSSVAVETDPACLWLRVGAAA